MPQRKIDRPTCLAPKDEIQSGKIAVNWYHDTDSDRYRCTVSKKAAQDLFAIADVTSICEDDRKSNEGELLPRIVDIPFGPMRLQAMECHAISLATQAVADYQKPPD